MIGCDSISLKIAGRDFSAAANRLHDVDDETGIREGCAWLLGLDAKTTKANALALAWLDVEIAEQDARRASGERCYRVLPRLGWDDVVVADGVSWADARAAANRYRPTRKYGARFVRVVKREAVK